MLKINNEDIRIRPSSIDTFYSCPYQWAKTHLEGISSIPNSRAAIGTAIHAGIEQSWREAMSCGKAEHNITLMKDAAIESFQETIKEGAQFGDDETIVTCEREVIGGIECWKEDVAPFVAIPKAVETFYTIPVSNPLASEVGGTLDYLAEGVIDDVKTSKRKVTASSYMTQQSTYKMLAEHHGEVIKHSRLQNVVLKKSGFDGHILALEPDVQLAKNLINGILEVLEIAAKDIMPLTALFRGNPKHVFCSDKFCAHHATCPFVRGTAPEPRKADIASIKL